MRSVFNGLKTIAGDWIYITDYDQNQARPQRDKLPNTPTGDPQPTKNDGLDPPCVSPTGHSDASASGHSNDVIHKGYITANQKVIHLDPQRWSGDNEIDPDDTPVVIRRGSSSSPSGLTNSSSSSEAYPGGQPKQLPPGNTSTDRSPLQQDHRVHRHYDTFQYVSSGSLPSSPFPEQRQFAKRATVPPLMSLTERDGKSEICDVKQQAPSFANPRLPPQYKDDRAPANNDRCETQFDVDSSTQQGDPAEECPEEDPFVLPSVSCVLEDLLLGGSSWTCLGLEVRQHLSRHIPRLFSTFSPVFIYTKCLDSDHLVITLPIPCAIQKRLEHCCLFALNMVDQSIVAIDAEFRDITRYPKERNTFGVPVHKHPSSGNLFSSTLTSPSFIAPESGTSTTTTTTAYDNRKESSDREKDDNSQEETTKLPEQQLLQDEDESTKSGVREPFAPASYPPRLPFGGNIIEHHLLSRKLYASQDTPQTRESHFSPSSSSSSSSGKGDPRSESISGCTRFELDIVLQIEAEVLQPAKNRCLRWYIIGSQKQQ